MSDQQFEENARLFAAGRLSRRQFINRLVAGGVSVVAAAAFVNASTTNAFAGQMRGGWGHVYGQPGHIYGHHGHVYGPGHGDCGSGHVYGSHGHGGPHPPPPPPPPPHRRPRRWPWGRRRD